MVAVASGLGPSETVLTFLQVEGDAELYDVLDLSHSLGGEALVYVAGLQW